MNSHSTVYSKLSGATRSRRHAAGKYPTQAQAEALKKSGSLAGRANLSVEDMLHLAAHPYLTASQRAAWAAKAAAT